MIKTNKRAAMTVAAIFMGIASPAGANVVNGQVTFEATRCPGDCTGEAVNPFADTISLGQTQTDITGPMSLGSGGLIEGLYLGANSFGFDIATVANPSLGGIISGIDFEETGTKISGITVSFDGELDEAMMFAAYMPNSVAVFVEKTTQGGSAITGGRVTIDLLLDVPSSNTIEKITDPSVAAVPVPGALPMMLAGLAGFGAFAGRKPKG